MLETAREMELDEQETRLLIAIRMHEAGEPGKECGVLYRLDGTPLSPYTFWPLSLQENALCARKIKLVYTKKFGRDLERFAAWYAPIGAANDPHGLNAHWLPLVRRNMKKLKEDFKMRCKDPGCMAEIEFVKNPKTGKLMPVEPRKVWVFTEDGKMVKGRICHFSTCPAAEKFSRKGPKPKKEDDAK